MKVLDLCAGIGGFSLAAHWMGWETVAFCERDKFCQKVLAKNFPGVEIYDDVYTFPSDAFRGRVDVLSAGFPCQPFSQAGKQLGRNDERHLFPKILEIVASIRPTWCVFENVRGLLSIESGQVFAEIVTSLEGQGYEVITFCIPASALNAPHRRDRLWIVAHAEDERTRRGQRAIRGTQRRSDGGLLPEPCDTSCDVANADCKRRSGSKMLRQQSGRTDAVGTNRINDSNPTGLYAQRRGIRQGEVQSRGSNWSRQWPEVAAELCRVDDVVPNRVDRLKSLGNAIVPSIAYELFKAIEEADK